MRVKLFIFCLSGVLFGCLGSGCQNFPPRIYKLDLKQGIHYSKKTVHKIKPGMKRATVKDILGPPSLSSILDHQKWIYTYSETLNNQREIISQKFIVFFKNDRVDRIMICEL